MRQNDEKEKRQEKSGDENGETKHVNSKQTISNQSLYLFDRQIRIRRNHSARREIHALAGQVAAEATLLALQSLTQRTQRLARVVHRVRETGHVRVDQHGHLRLEELPELHECRGLGTGGVGQGGEVGRRVQ
jgi:hypothetical protein